jgi:hypothetical protein
MHAMNKFELSTMLREAATRMRNGLASQLVPHSGERGVGREVVVRRFLSDHLPKRFKIDTGFVIDHSGACSDQMDIVIVDNYVCPLFEDAGERRFFPVEAVVAVGQVRSSATSRGEWKSALTNLESVKRLDRSGGGQSLDLLHGEKLDHTSNHLHQVFSFFFVCGETLAPGTARRFLMDYLAGREPHLWPNICFAMDRYLLTFCCDHGVCPNPMDARGLTLQLEKSPGQILLRLYLMLAQAIEVTRTSALPFNTYLSHLEPWSTDVIYAATDDPPPYLHQALGLFSPLEEEEGHCRAGD